jgi:hypothetical protein
MIGGLRIGAQPQRPLAPLPASGLRVAPFFEGWYLNPDGTATLSFGYSNQSRDEVVEIPIGPDNFIEPKEFNGRQPTSFPTPVPDRNPDGGGGGGNRRQREFGVFTVTVPPGFKGDVVWTLRVHGQTYSVPGHTRTGAYHLNWPMAMGSMPPLLRFKADGPAGRGPAGIESGPMRASVGVPLTLTIWATDDSKREADPVPMKERQKAAINITWFKHAGPGAVAFKEPKQGIADLKGTTTTTATFQQPGEYVIRVRVDSFGRIDSAAADQCCWTNGYVKVTVAP